jgi:hypothetical protein
MKKGWEVDDNWVVFGIPPKFIGHICQNMQQPVLFLSSSSSATGQNLHIATQNLLPNRVQCTKYAGIRLQVPNSRHWNKTAWRSKAYSHVLLF